jgi:hypothetical protein
MAPGQEVPVPDSLRPWKEWSVWEDRHEAAPPRFDQIEDRVALWAGRLDLEAGSGGGRFGVEVRVYAPAWLGLPGEGEMWPVRVTVDGEPAVVVEREGRPSVRLEPGSRRVAGEFEWKEMPQRIPLPPEVGILGLSMEGAAVEWPNWDEKGFLWLRRTRTEETEREFLAAQVYRVLEDGIPMWLRTEIELSVAGKSREEDLGHALPEGWTVSGVESALPAAVDDAGRLKVQARAGKWTVRIDAFRSQPAETVAFASGAVPVVGEEIVAFLAKPGFRVVELEGLQAIDVSQTTLPERWRDLPVYRWVPSSAFRLQEKMRGMGLQKPAGLSVEREFWLDDGGELMTFRDRIRGTSQQSWRLDVSPGQKLGAARLAGEGQLITRNPATGASGIEVRQRDVDLEAVGRIEDAREFPASGWQADVDRCEATLHLPPGWRVLALLGAEWVRGDWVTSWTLLDLFLLLVFAMAVGRLWGPVAAVVAVAGFGMAYHEPDAPRWLWFFLLVPLAMLRALPAGRVRRVVGAWKLLAAGALWASLAPFVTKQVQGVLYPQLEPVRETGLPFVTQVPRAVADLAEESSFRSYPGRTDGGKNDKLAQQVQLSSNLAYDSKAQIQTGPAIPDWAWREVRFGWRGPVAAGEAVRVILIPPSVQRGITLCRVVLLILLAAVLLEANRLLPPFLRRRAKRFSGSSAAVAAGWAVVGVACWGGAGAGARAQDSPGGFPSAELLETLRERLREPSDAFPRAAEIPAVKLVLGSRSLAMDAEIHVAARCAVPLPGKLPAWSPVTVLVDGVPAEAAGRRDGFLWVVLEPGVRRVRVEGLLPGVTEWEWNFLLKPRRLEVEAPGWTVAGIKPNGVPEDQVFFAVKTPAAAAEAAYDRKDFTPAVAVERALEIGLVWQARSTVRRLSPGGKAVALSVPLLPGERVLSANVTVSGGQVEVRLGAGEESVHWESELDQAPETVLTAEAAGRWVERWRLIASPVWNVGFRGVAPVYEAGSGGLEPVWNPWPGERVELALTRPEAVPGATLTVREVAQTTAAGSRQRVSRLRLEVQASLGQDFGVGLPEGSEVTSLRIEDDRNPGGALQPVRRDGANVIIPVRPGDQTIHLEWKALRPLGRDVRVDPVALPTESSNLNLTLELPENRWVLWADGPLRGPAVRLWVVAAVAVIGAFVLGRLRLTPLAGTEWALLALGLTQVHAAAALVVVGWLFLLAWRGTDAGTRLRPWTFNALQAVLIVGAVPVAATILAALHRGLLGAPEMMVQGNGSSPAELRWFAQRAEGTLPGAGAVAVSVWWYRLLMLAWALWLAASALRWIRWGWSQFTRDHLFRASARRASSPPPPPPVPGSAAGGNPPPPR